MTDNTDAPKRANEDARADGGKEAVATAWNSITEIEGKVNVIRAMLRGLNLAINADTVDDQRDIEALFHMIWAAEAALKDVEEARAKAFHVLHPIVYGPRASLLRKEGGE